MIILEKIMKNIGAAEKLASELPRIAVPDRFIQFDQLPRMGSGKVDFRDTTDLVLQRLERI